MTKSLLMKIYIQFVFLLILLVCCKKEDDIKVLVSASVENSSEGTVEFSAGEFSVGSSHTFTANPSEGYTFSNWKDASSNQVYVNNPLTITVNDNVSLIAIFQKSAFSIDVNILGDGTIQKENLTSGNSEFLHGDTVELTALPASNYAFFYWNNDPIDTSNPKNIVVDGNMSLEAKFEFENAKKMIGTWEFDINNQASKAHNKLIMTVDIQLNCLMITKINDQIVSQVYTDIKPLDPGACVIGDFAVMTNVSVVASQTLAMKMVTLPDNSPIPTNISEVNQVIETGVELGLSGTASVEQVPETDASGIIIIPTEAANISDTTVNIAQAFNEGFVKLALIQSPTLTIPANLPMPQSFDVSATLIEFVQSGDISGTFSEGVLTLDTTHSDSDTTTSNSEVASQNACTINTSLISNPLTEQQSVAPGAPITDIIYDIITDCPQITHLVASNGLPSGVSASILNNDLIITGVPTTGSLGVYNYSITLDNHLEQTSTEPFVSATTSTVVNGSITVTDSDTTTSNSEVASQTACTINTSLISNPLTEQQSVAPGAPITDIIYDIITDCPQITHLVASNGLPSGVSASILNNDLIITGVPTTGSLGVYNYSITLDNHLEQTSTEPFVSATTSTVVNGSITVTDSSTSGTSTPTGGGGNGNIGQNPCLVNTSFSSNNADQTIDEGSSIVDMIGQVVTTGCDTPLQLGNISGLPQGVTANLINNVLTISGTPVSGSTGRFDFSVSLVSGTSSQVIGGSITVNSQTQSQTSNTSTSTTNNQGANNSFNFFVTASSASDYTINGTDRNGTVSGNDPTITINFGDSINFNVNAPGHPFYVKTIGGVGTNNLALGVSNNGVTSGTVMFAPTSSGTYYYQCSLHGGMVGTIIVN